ncbi:MAG TPA: hypothetical protein VFM00_12800 [Candidatus Eisenbacteria bacterium]|jgi:hypothetical protein|nr:hypothetical protein [Candidatus Eisenbacteria bacterium]
MAGFKRPSFLKKQKEQKRVAKAAEKRAARQARREAQRTDDLNPAAGELVEDTGIAEEGAEATETNGEAGEA